MRSVVTAPGGPVLLCALLFVIASAGAEDISITTNVGARGFELVSQSRGGVQIHYGMDRFGLEPITVDGAETRKVLLPGSFLPNNAGAPDLPSIGRTVAIPRGARAHLTILSQQTDTYTDLDVTPAPPIPKVTDTSPPIYERDPSIYGADAAYPPSPVMVSDPWTMRGVEVVSLGITPFQYNPVRRELTVYTELEVRLDFEGGEGDFCEMRLRSPYWEPLLRDHLINYETLPEADFDGSRLDRDGYEYVIICPDNPVFTAWADTLQLWRSLQGIKTGVFTTTDIGGQASGVIESWLNSAAGWDLPPVAFLILGDYPNSGDRDDGIYSPIYNGYCVSDNKYADIGGNNLPDMAHGRICARDATELENAIGKMLRYERDPVTDPAFYRNPLITGGWQDDRWFILCAEILFGHQQHALGKAPLREYAICSGNPGSVWSTNGNTNTIVNYFGPNGLGYIPATPSHLTDWDGDHNAITLAINRGCYVVLHRDHGLESGWGEPSYTHANLSNLTNTKYPFVFSINCLTGKYNHDVETFSEKFHRMANGALGLLAASETSFSFVNDAFMWGVWDSMWPDFDPGHGYPFPVDDYNVGSSELRTAFAHVSGKYYLQASGWPTNPSQKSVTYHLFHHHGDAFMRINSEVPTELDVVHDDYCEIGQETFSVQADAGAMVGLTVDGEIVGVEEATGEMMEIPITAQTEEGALRITVTKANHMRYDVSVPIRPAYVLVKPDGSGSFATIQAAVDAATDGDEVYLDDGVFTGSGNRDIDFHGRVMTLQSLSGNAGACIIDCEGSEMAPHRGFHFHTGETGATVLRDFTVRNGYVTTSGGGAILCEGASPTIDHCIFEENVGPDGGAIACLDASPTITECLFHANVATATGGAMQIANGAPLIELSIMWANSADRGGALALAGSAPQITQCTLHGGTGQTEGAGLYLADGSAPVMENTIISGSRRGEAVACDAESAPLIQCCDIFDNAGGDWTGCIAEQAGRDGNFSLDPYFCSPFTGNFELYNYSPCQQAVCGLIGAGEIQCWDYADGSEAALGGGLRLRRCAPNPFQSTTRIDFEIPATAAGSRMRMEVMDATGRRVRTLIDAPASSGVHAVTWDGADHSGRPMPGGIYYCRLRMGDDSLTRPVVLLR